MSWQILSWNQDKVREALQGGEYNDASLTGQGRLDDLMALAEGLGILRELDGISPELTRGGSNSRWFIHRALWLRTVVGDESMSALQERLLRDAGVLRLLGRTAGESREGFAAGPQPGRAHLVSRGQPALQPQTDAGAPVLRHLYPLPGALDQGRLH